MKKTLKLVWNGIAGLGWLAVVVLVGPSLMSADPSKRPSGGEFDGEQPILVMIPDSQPGERRVDAESARDVHPVNEGDRPVLGRGCRSLCRSNLGRNSVPSPRNPHDSKRPRSLLRSPDLARLRTSTGPTRTGSRTPTRWPATRTTSCGGRSTSSAGDWGIGLSFGNTGISGTSTPRSAAIYRSGWRISVARTGN